MKFFVAAVACILFGVAFAQTDEDLPFACWEGRTVNGVGNITEVVCPEGDMQTCQTKFETQGPDVIIDRECKQTQACMNNYGNNGQQCYGDTAVRNGVRICHFCCDDRLCNNFDVIPPQPTEAATEAPTEPATEAPNEP